MPLLLTPREELLSLLFRSHRRDNRHEQLVMKNNDVSPRPRFANVWPNVLVLGLVLTVLFGRGFPPGFTVFSNDGPLGAISTEFVSPPAAFSGIWQDLNWIGGNGGALQPNISGGLLWLLGPGLFSKVYAPFALLFLGLSAWFCFRKFGFTPLACSLGGIAVALNSDFFATACWGVCAQPIAFGLSYLAVGLLADQRQTSRWARVILAGFMVGMNVMEAFDIGALFSLAVAAFVLAQSFVVDGSLAKRTSNGFSRLALVASFAGIMAMTALVSLVGTQVKGVVGMSQDAETKAMRWDQATQWSIPKAEILSLVIPNFFGARMDTPEGGAYWGIIGQSPSITAYLDAERKEGQVPGGFFRYGGGAGYAGMLVLLVAAWAVAQSFRSDKSFFSKSERRLIWFWLGVIVLAMLLMFGRFAPFYQFFYALPYASTIRNPAKFYHILQWALLIVFAYGMHGLATLYLNPAAAVGRDLMEQVRQWWQRSAGFERAWVKGSFGVLGGAIIAGVGFYALRGNLVRYIAELNRVEQLSRGQTPDLIAAEMAAQATVSFSTGQVVWAIVALAVAVGLVTLVISGYFNGRRVKAALIVLGLFVVIDLGWHNRPYVVIQNWKEKYESNSVVDFLRERPYEQRVAIFPLERFVDVRRLPREAIPTVQQFQFFSQLYGIEWTQHLFQYYNVQSLDIVQEPRMATDKAAYEAVMYFHPVRRWELTSTRYLLGPTGFADFLNQQVDIGKGRFQIARQFNLAAKPGVDSAGARGEQITTAITTNGALAVFDFTGALPRAKLYSRWRVSTNEPAQVQAWAKEMQGRVPPDWASALAAQSETDLATLRDLADPAFDPAQTVLLAKPLSATPTANPDPGTVTYESYAPKHIKLTAKANAPGVLLLNDKFDQNWRVTVNGQPAELLRANFIVRGVFLEQAGEHTVEFRFQPPMRGFFVSLTAILVAVGLLCYLGIANRKAPTRSPE
jgi:hypothetical protein